jgi:Leucine-rich repeat (LRR) protein
MNESLTAKSVNLDFLPKSLQDLDLSMNKLNNIIGLLNLERLENLNISSCFLKGFEFSQVPQNLKRLNLRDNELTIFPKAPNNLMSDLEYLDVSHNHISEIPTEIVNLKSLNEFLCSHNKLESLPEADSFWAGIIQ